MENNKEKLQIVSSEELGGLDLGDLNLESQFYIPMELDNLEGIKYDKKEFDKGVKDYSYVAGAISSLLNAGLSSTDALNYIINRETIEHNFKLQEIINANNKEVAEIQELKIQSQQL